MYVHKNMMAPPKYKIANEKVLGKKSDMITDQFYAVSIVDKEDPLYDSQSEDDCFYAVVNFGTNESASQLGLNSTPENKSQRIPALSYERFVERISTLSSDFFSEKDAMYVGNALKKLECPSFHPFFVVRAIRLSFDEKEEDRQRISSLLSALYEQQILTKEHIVQGLEKLVQSIEDIHLDVPFVADYLFTFIQCAMDDGCINSSYLQRLPEQFLVATSLFENKEEALTLLRNFKKRTKKCIALYYENGSSSLIEEFLSNDAYPNLRHEFVRLLIAESFEKKSRHRELVSIALQKAFELHLSTSDIQFGFYRLLGDIEDLELDTVDVVELMSKFLIRAVVDQILSPMFIHDAFRLHFGGILGMNSLRKVQRWLTAEKGLLERHRKVWTSCDPSHPVALDFQKKAKIVQNKVLRGENKVLISEYIQEMELCPDQECELVRNLILFSIKPPAESFMIPRLVSLLKLLIEKNEFIEETISTGYTLASQNLNEPEELEVLRLQFVSAGILENNETTVLSSQ